MSAVITYDDGFKQNPPEPLTFCFYSNAIAENNNFVIQICPTDDYIRLMEHWDGYPSTKYEREE